MLPGIIARISWTKINCISFPGGSAVRLAAFLLILEILPFSVSLTQAQDRPDDDALILELEPVVVVSDPIQSERKLENPTKFMTVIDTSEAPAKVTTVSEVLDEAVGVQVNHYGGMGTFATVSIRGSNPNQVQVYLDGVPMNRAMSGVTNIEDLPLDNIEYIEVYRGFVPADFGQAGIGGAINLVTRKGVEQTFDLSASYGSYRTYRITGIGAGPVGSASVLLFYEYAESRGDYEFRNDNGTPLNHRDDFDDTRRNNQFHSHDLTLSVSYPLGDWEISTVGVGHLKDQGLPGLQRVQAEHTALDNSRGSLTLNVRNRVLMSGALDLSLGVDGLWETQEYDDPGGELGTGGARRNEDRMDTLGARTKAVLSDPDRILILTNYLEYRQENYLGIEHEPVHHRGERQSRNTFTHVAQLEWTGAGGTFSVLGSHRWEYYENRFHGDPNFNWSAAAGENFDTYNFSSPSTGVIFRIGDSLQIKGNLGRYYRVPTFYEMFGDRGAAVGNTELQPERGVNYDLGGVYHYRGDGPIDSFFLEYAYFHSEVDDMIIFFQNSQRTIKSTNIGAALIWGHEVSWGVKFLDTINISGNYTFQSAVDRGDVAYWRGNALPMRPMHQGYVKVEYSPVAWLQPWTDLTYMSEDYLDRANLYRTDERFIWNAGVTFEHKIAGADCSLTAEGKNLTDNRITDVAGYPMPGRSFFVTIRAGF